MMSVNSWLVVRWVDLQGGNRDKSRRGGEMVERACVCILHTCLWGLFCDFFEASDGGGVEAVVELAWLSEIASFVKAASLFARRDLRSIL